jgi:hypothetical protein
LTEAAPDTVDLQTALEIIGEKRVTNAVDYQIAGDAASPSLATKIILAG